MILKEKMTLKEISQIVGRHESTIRPKLENKNFFANITQDKVSGTRFYIGVTEQNIRDLENMHKYKRWY